MFLELIIALIVGILCGIFTGLAPGIHINLIAATLIASLPSFPTTPRIALATFIVSLSITHLLVDFIPSIFLGAPEEDTFLAMLPGHQLLHEGRGYEAIVLTSVGAMLGLAVIAFVTPLYLLILPTTYLFITATIPYLLIAISAYLVCRDTHPLIAGSIFLLSGLLGLLTFHLPVKEPLMPLLTGLFGLSALLTASANKEQLPAQQKLSLKKVMPSKKEMLRAGSAALLSAPFCSFLPGIGSGHAAVIGSEILPQKNKEFLMLVGALGVAVMTLSFVTVFSIEKSRTGSAAALQELLIPFTLEHLFFLLFIATLTLLLVFPLTLFIARHASQFMNHFNYASLSKIIALLLIALTLFFSNFLGLIVLGTATAIGILCIQTGVRRINLMAALILPSITYYLLF